MNDDPISQLPRPYRAAWELLRTPFDRFTVLKKVLESAKEITGAEWGMVILDSELDKFQGSFPEFHVLEDISIVTNKIPIGHAAWLAYAFGKKVLQSGVPLLIADTKNIVELDETVLINEFVPLEMRERILAEANGYLERMLIDIPDTYSSSIFVVPMLSEAKSLGAVYLSRPTDYGVFSKDNLEDVITFLSLSIVAIKNVQIVDDVTGSAGQFPAIVSSELKNPFVSIRGYASLLLERTGDLKQKMGPITEIESSFLKHIISSTERALYILGAFGILSRIEGNRIRAYREKISGLVTPLVEKYRPLFDEKQQNFIFDVGSLPDIKVDYFLGEVIDTLLKNSYLYTPIGGKIEVTAALNDGFLVFKIVDTGIGLSEVDISRLFSKYYRSDREEVREHWGMGLGLYIAKRLLDIWGGEIGAEGSPNQGSTFWFTLPTAKE